MLETVSAKGAANGVQEVLSTQEKCSCTMVVDSDPASDLLLTSYAI